MKTAKKLGYEPINFVTATKESHYKGLTKREYFAGLAMQGILNDPQPISNSINDNVRLTAEHSVKYADALLEELSKQ